MRGESMKGKSKKSTYSTTFGVDPTNQQTERVKPPANPQKIKGLRLQTLYFSVAVQAGIEPATK